MNDNFVTLLAVLNDKIQDQAREIKDLNGRIYSMEDNSHSVPYSTPQSSRISPGYAGIILSGDALNSGGEPGGGFVKVTHDGGAVAVRAGHCRVLTAAGRADPTQDRGARFELTTSVGGILGIHIFASGPEGTAI